MTRIGPVETRTEENGSYALKVSCAGGHNAGIRLQASKPGFALAIADVDLRHVDPSETIEVPFRLKPLAQPAGLRGALLSAEGHPLGGERMHIASASLGTRYTAITSARGRFRFDGVEPAKDYRLWVFPSGPYRDRVVRPLEVSGDLAGEQGEIEMRLDSLGEGRLNLLIANARGVPLAGRTFKLRSAYALGRTLVECTNRRGLLVVEGVPAGPIVLQTRGRPRAVVRGLVVVPGETLMGKVTIGVGEQRVRGRTITTATGKPLGGARVVVSWRELRDGVQSSLAQETRAAPDGKFVIDGLGPGSCSVTVAARKHRPETLHFSIPPQAPAIELHVALTPLTSGPRHGSFKTP